MNIKHKMMLGTALPIVMAAALTMGTTAASATEVLAFGQVGTGSNVTATAVGGTTTISVTNQEVSVTSCLGCSALITPQELTFSAHSIGAATSTGTPAFVQQAYAGSFSITAGAQNILSGTFTDAVFGSGGSLTLSTSDTGGESLVLTSNVIPAVDLGVPEAFSLSFSNVTPAVGTTNPSGCSGTTGCTLASATMSVAGTASATPVPEPSTLALFGASLLALGALSWRRKQRSA